MKTIIFRGSSFVVLDLQHDLPRNEHWPYGSRWSPPNQRFVRGRSPYEKVDQRTVRKAWLHHTGGKRKKGSNERKGKGFKGPLATASYVCGNPRVVDDKIDTGYGRGWPGICYHAYVPFAPIIDKAEGLPVIYQCWPPDMRIWHTKGHNTHGYGFVCQGSFVTDPGEPGTEGHPSELQFELVQAAWDEWLKPMLGLTDADLYGHADATKPSCPGGTLYDFVIGRREQRTTRKLEADHDCTERGGSNG